MCPFVKCIIKPYIINHINLIRVQNVVLDQNLERVHIPGIALMPSQSLSIYVQEPNLILAYHQVIFYVRTVDMHLAILNHIQQQADQPCT